MELEETNSAGDFQRESPSKFVGSMAEKLGAAARAATIFGDPVERDGVTVIPVARARWGFGGGMGRRKEENGAGGGGSVQLNGDTTKALQAYQDFFAIWKEADPDIPILMEAKKGYEKLK
jgi:hypothetical protein